MNKTLKILFSIGLLFSLLIQSITAIQVAAVENGNKKIDIEEGLIGYWDFEDGTAENSVDPEKNGELIGDNISIKGVEKGKALYLDGDAESYMKIPDIMNTGESSYTLSLWHKSINDSGNKHSVIAQQDGPGRSLLLLTSTNKYRTFVSGSDVDSVDSIDQTNWNHISITVDHENKKTKFYINGRLDSEVELSNNLVNEVTNLLIGRHKDGGTDPAPMKGYIDELRVYQKVINDEEAAAIYQVNKPFTTLEDDLIGYWNFDDGEARNLVTDEVSELIGDNIVIGASSHSEMDQSLRFSKGNDSYMKVTDFINTAENPYSFSMWYKTDGVSENQHTVLLQQNNEGRSLLNLRVDGAYETYVNGKETISEEKVVKDIWQHVVMTVDPYENAIKYYINGEFEGKYEITNNYVADLTDLLIGIHKQPNDQNPQQMVGEIDEIRIYNKVIDDRLASRLFEDIKENEADKEPLKLSVNVQDVERMIDDSIFGINHRYAFNGYGMFDSEKGKVREDFSELYGKADFGSIRYPGGTISNLFRWKDSIGEMEERKKQIHGFYNVAEGIAPNFGLTEIGDFANEYDSELVYVYGLGRGSAQDAADLVEYLNAEVGTNPNGGIEWAKVRAANGREEPYNVRFFEIGNEMQQDFGGPDGDGSISQAYWTQYGGSSEERYIHGGTIKFDKQPVVDPENWNTATHKSNGEANQTKYMRYANTPPDTGVDDSFEFDTFTAIEEDSVHVFVEGEEWEIVDSLQEAVDENVVEVDYYTGEIHFGDGENGNIPAKEAQITVSYHVEKDGFVEVSKAMRDTMDQINESSDVEEEIYVYAGYESKGFIESMKQTDNEGLYDGLTIHPYSGTPDGNGETFYESAMHLADINGIKHVESYVEMLPEDKVPVISEFGIFNSTNPLVRSQTHALYMAKVMMEYVKLGSPYIQKHTLVDWYSSGADALGPTQQAVIQAVPQEGADIKTGEGEYEFFSTPSAHVFEMLNSTFGNEIIATEFNRMDTFGQGTDTLSALASKDNQGNIYIATVNLDIEKEKILEIDVNGLDVIDKEIEVQTIAGDSFSAENTLSEPDNVSIEKSSFVVEDEQLSIELSPHSFTILKINNNEELSVDKQELDVLIMKAEAKQESEYTTETWGNLEAKLKDARKVYKDDNASQEEVDQVVSALSKAINLLEKQDQAEEVDKSILGSLIEEAENEVASAYTDASWKVFSEALKNAKEIEASEEVTQEEIDESVTALTVALEQLEKKDLEEEEEEGSKEEEEDENTVPDIEESDKENNGNKENNENTLKPEDKEDENDGSDDTNKSTSGEGEKLPSTATNNGNFLLIGLVLVGLSFLLFFVRRFKKAKI